MRALAGSGAAVRVGDVDTSPLSPIAVAKTATRFASPISIFGTQVVSADADYS
jgi:hypothetical protein